MLHTPLTIKNVSKSFHVGDQDVPVLKNVSFEIESGDFVIILGPSGCGKSTLLHTILGLELPTKGTVYLNGMDLYAKSITEDIRAQIRKTDVGMIYQQPNWIKSVSVIDNVAFPLALQGVSKAKRLKKAYEELSKSKMVNWMDYLPEELSSGQQQKVALARALITGASIIIADEPTGNLDEESGKDLMNLLKNLNETEGKTILMVTHDLVYVDYAKRVIRMKDGEVVEDKVINKRNGKSKK